MSSTSISFPSIGVDNERKSLFNAGMGKRRWYQKTPGRFAPALERGLASDDERLASLAWIIIEHTPECGFGGRKAVSIFAAKVPNVSESTLSSLFRKDKPPENTYTVSNELEQGICEAFPDVSPISFRHWCTPLGEIDYHTGEITIDTDDSGWDDYQYMKHLRRPDLYSPPAVERQRRPYCFKLERG